MMYLAAAFLLIVCLVAIGVMSLSDFDTVRWHDDDGPDSFA